MKKLLTFATLALAFVYVQAKDIKTVVFTTTPQMHCAACENKIKNNLKYEKGVKLIETNIEEQKVTVTYDADKTSVDKLEKAFEKFNYQARQLNTDEKVNINHDESCSNM